MKQLQRCAWLFFILLSGPTLAGCGSSPAAPGPMMQTPEVQVSLPVIRSVTDYADFPGRLEAVNSIEVRARVTGYLDKVHFKEGADVKKDDLLFEIDPRPYQADLDRAEGNVVQSEGRLRRLESDFRRASVLVSKGAMGQEDFDRVAGDRTEAAGAVRVAKASRDMARLNLSFTQVRAPINGRISRRYIDPGNLVKADDTSLTTLVTLDPIYAYFDLDERTTLRLQRLIRAGKIVWSVDKGLPVLLGLSDEEGFPKQGTINFSDNRVDPDTGTWRLRGLFANPDLAFSPGLFVRVRLPIGEPYQAILISEQALSTDQGQKYVYVVTPAGKAAYRRVKIGRLHDGLRVIGEGLKPGEPVVVSGLQRIRPDMEVISKTVDMPVVTTEENPKSEIRDPKETQNSKSE